MKYSANVYKQSLLTIDFFIVLESEPKGSYVLGRRYSTTELWSCLLFRFYSKTASH